MLPAAICTRCTAKHHPPHRGGRLPKIGKMCKECAAVVSRNFSDAAADAYCRYQERAGERETRPARPASGHRKCARGSAPNRRGSETRARRPQKMQNGKIEGSLEKPRENTAIPKTNSTNSSGTRGTVRSCRSRRETCSMSMRGGNPSAPLISRVTDSRDRYLRDKEKGPIHITKERSDGKP